jgi:cellulose synthase operon protein C
VRQGLKLACALAPAVALAACASRPPQGTLAELHLRPADLREVPVEQGLEKAMQSYRRYLEETPRTAMTPEAMRRLADLQIEKEFGLRGDGKLVEMAAPEEGAPLAAARPAAATGIEALTESDAEFERRTTRAHGGYDEAAVAAAPAGGEAPSGPLEAIALYDRLLEEYPGFEHNDQVLYQKARAYDELGRTEEAMATMDRLVTSYAYSAHYDEVQFRRAEYFFTRRKFREAEAAYQAIVAMGTASSYYELALYKQGWTLYKQEFYDEAQHRFMALLDYKVSVGYDFDQSHEEDEQRRIADTFRVISLGFSNLGGAEVVQEYFAEHGRRGYEDRIYGNLGEFYFAKLRYDDAAKTYGTFVELHPFHRASPRFGMRVIEIYTRADFPRLVLEAKKDFASRYGLQSEYWRHFDVAGSPEVLAYLKSNLRDLANHYHAQYQDAGLVAERPAHYAEAQRWYRDYLTSFPKDADTPPIHYQLADLMLENGDYGDAALQYERTAYDYPAHAQSGAAGYAAIYAHRQHLTKAADAEQEAVRRRTVESSLRFADAFPAHEHAPAVLGAAAEDLYGMKDHRPAVETAARLIERYPAAPTALLRSAWLVVAHGSFDLAEFPRAEHAYARVLEATPADDPARAGLVDNLAASIYKQGELAGAQQDWRAAADHFLRVKQAAPTSTIRAAAEYDAAAALVRVEEWTAAAGVLEAFRSAHPDHQLKGDATRQLAVAYRQSGELGRAAAEYERIAGESADPALRGEALLEAGELYEQSGSNARALAVYERYVEQYPHPIDVAVHTRSKVASMHKTAGNEARYLAELEQIVRVDAGAGAERTGRTRTTAGRAALVLAERTYERYAELPLRQPFDASLKEKKRRMDAATSAFNRLVEYQVGDVTAAATYYMAQIYLGLSRALMESERPAGLAAADRQEYELALEEEAYPFEERAIQVHEKNMELMRTGLYNAWIDRSLSQLADLMPARYAKGEISTGFLGSIDRYAYRAPVRAPAPEAPAAPAVPAETDDAEPATAEPATPTAQAPAPATEARTQEVALAQAH